MAIHNYAWVGTFYDKHRLTTVSEGRQYAIFTEMLDDDLQMITAIGDLGVSFVVISQVDVNSLLTFEESIIEL